VRRLVLVAIPEQDEDPVGTYARVALSDPRQFAVVEDRLAFTAWIARRYPSSLIVSGDGVAVARDVERTVLQRCAARGGWIAADGVGYTGELVGPVEAVPGVLVKTDGKVRIVGTPPDGSVLESWVSPFDIEVASGELADRVERVQSGRYRRG
jgi:hypothetical protein